MQIPSGTKLGPYEIQALIGAGGMGEVYRARDTRLDRLVAVKRLSPALASDPQFRERFDREARTIAALSHPHICAIHDIGRQGDTEFLVMELLEGRTLADRLGRGALSIDEALTVGAAIAGALEHAHRASIVHRDLKPANVMLTKAGPKLLDFGLARPAALAIAAGSVSVAPTRADGVTVKGTILGTLQYMAPEQLEGREADSRADIWAFGCVLYEMVTGARPFAGRSHASLITAVMSGTPRPIQELTPVAPPLLDRLIRACMAKDPDDRIQSAHDIVIDLGWVRDAAANPPASPESRRRVRLLPTALIALALAGAAGAGYFAARPAALPPAQVRFELPPPAGMRFNETHAISPDARFVVAVATDAEGAQRLWLRPLDTGEARMLPGTEGAEFPFWSPDSRSVGFFARGRLKRIDLGHMAPIDLCPAPTGRGGTFVSAAEIVFAPTHASGLMRVPALGGEAVPYTSLATSRRELSHRFPVAAPDGRVGFYVLNENASDNAFWLAGPTDSDEPRRLVRADGAQLGGRYLFFSRDGSLLAQAFDAAESTLVGTVYPLGPIPRARTGGAIPYSASPGGSVVLRRPPIGFSQFKWVGRDGTTQAVLGEPGQQGDPSLSADGGRLAFSRAENGSTDIWVLDAARNAMTRLTADPVNDRTPVWAPDGSRIVFSSSRGPSGVSNLYGVTTDASGDPKPVVDGVRGSLYPAGWTPDGKSFVWLEHAPPTSRIWMQGPDGRARALLTASFTIEHVQLSPDGRWVAYTSNQSGRREVYVAAFPALSGVRQVSSEGATQPRWRRDGRELFFVSAAMRMTAVSVTHAGSALEFGAPAALFDLALAGLTAHLHQYDVAPDGQRFIVNAIGDDTPTPLTVMLHWEPPADSALDR